MTPEILQEDFIGLDAEIIGSSNPSCVGISGRVIDETRNTLVLLQDDEEKVIVKELSVFHFKLPDGTIVRIDGKAIIGRPEDRVKRKIRRRW